MLLADLEADTVDFAPNFDASVVGANSLGAARLGLCAWTLHCWVARNELPAGSAPFD